MVSPFALNLKSNTKEAGNTDTFSPSFKIVLLVNSASVGSEFIRITSGGYLFYLFRVLNRSTFICKSWLALDSVNGKLERRFRAATRDQKRKIPIPLLPGGAQCSDRLTHLVVGCLQARTFYIYTCAATLLLPCNAVSDHGGVGHVLRN